MSNMLKNWMCGESAKAEHWQAGDKHAVAISALRVLAGEGQLGFSLVELMAVVSIVGILSMIALPSYTDYVIRGKIPDATSTLATKRVQMEQFFQDNQTYLNAPACNQDTNTSAYFTFSCSTQTATAYTIQAVGHGSMAGFTFTVNQANAKVTTAVPTGWTVPSTNCWVTKKGGAC